MKERTDELSGKHKEGLFCLTKEVAVGWRKYQLQTPLMSADPDESAGEESFQTAGWKASYVMVLLQLDQ